MATQKGRNWSSGDIVTAANLSSIERGVSAVAEEYTPTTWVNGNTVTAAALNNIEQGIANAGGGSSDFSTAQVTIINNSNQDVYSYIPVVVDNTINIGSYLFPQGSGTYLVPLYKNRMEVFIYDDSIAETSGSVTYEDGVLVVTGDCTITISGGQIVA